MTLKRCRSCNDMYYWYYTEQTSRNAILCPECCNECEVVYDKIREYFSKNEDAQPFEITDSERIAEITDTSPVLVWVLKNEGRLGDTTRRFCTHCYTELREEEKKVCENCAIIISKKLAMALNSLAERWNTNTTVQTKKRRYGLGQHN